MPRQPRPAARPRPSPSRDPRPAPPRRQGRATAAAAPRPGAGGSLRAADHRAADPAPAAAARRRVAAPAGQRLGGDAQPGGGAVPLSARRWPTTGSPRRRAELADGIAYHLAITGREGDQEMLVGVVGLRLDTQGAHRPRSATGSAAASGATAWPPRPPAAWCAGASPTWHSTASSPRWRPTTLPPPRCCAASASARPARACKPSVARGDEAPVWHVRGHPRRHFRHPRGPGRDASRAPSRCCWSPPAP